MDLKLADFLYDLPEDRIAKHPPAQRGSSKLLVYNKGSISHHVFQKIDTLIPSDSLMVFNDTRVIPARIIMHKETGAKIEIFLLDPLAPSKVHEEVMDSKSECEWKCMIGNAKKWKIDSELSIAKLSLRAVRVSDDRVKFQWTSSLTFSELLLEIGKIPLPPYIDREVEEEDTERYQTVYSKMKGAVAAPTAGLHFTDEVLDKLSRNGVKKDFVTLHVSAGTFQPIKSDSIESHPMHNEQIWISRENIKNLLDAEKNIAVGTTSMRTMESLYWFGVNIINGSTDFFIKQTDPYQLTPVSKEVALQSVLNLMQEKNIEVIGGHTEIFLYPGYEFKICDGLVTNYHLPGSTLILLVAAFIGKDWRKVYQEALNSGYQFLSYGDSSLLLR